MKKKTSLIPHKIPMLHYSNELCLSHNFRFYSVELKTSIKPMVSFTTYAKNGFFSTNAYKKSFFVSIFKEDTSHDAFSHICLMEREENPCPSLHIKSLPGKLYEDLVTQILLNPKYFYSLVFISDFNTQHFKKLRTQLKLEGVKFIEAENSFSGHSDLLLASQMVRLVDAYKHYEHTPWPVDDNYGPKS